MWEKAHDVISARARDDIRWLGADWVLDELLRAMPDECERLEGHLVEQCETLAKAWIKAIQDAGKPA